MSVRIYLADVNESTLRSFGERALGLRHAALGGANKPSRKRRTQAVEHLMLGKGSIKYSVAHAPDGDRQTANDQKPARSAHS
jgi:hypothetical protein